MTTNEIDIEELIDVLEKIRSEQHPDIPSELIKNIVYAEFEKQDERSQGRKETVKLVDDFLKDVSWED